MIHTLKVRKIGNSLGIVLPKEVLGSMHTEEGQNLSLIETDQGFTLTPAKSEFAEAMAVFEDLAKRYRNTLAELAK